MQKNNGRSVNYLVFNIKKYAFMFVNFAQQIKSHFQSKYLRNNYCIYFEDKTQLLFEIFAIPYIT